MYNYLQIFKCLDNHTESIPQTWAGEVRDPYTYNSYIYYMCIFPQKKSTFYMAMKVWCQYYYSHFRHFQKPRTFVDRTFHINKFIHLLEIERYWVTFIYLRIDLSMYLSIHVRSLYSINEADRIYLIFITKLIPVIMNSLLGECWWNVRFIVLGYIKKISQQL